MAVLAERYGRACQNSPDVVNLEQLWGHFGVTLGSLWGQTGNNCDNRHSRWLFWRSDMAELARTALTLSTWSHFGVILGHFGFILSSLWPELAEVGAKLTLSWPNMAPSWPKLGPRWLQICTWGHSGSTLGSLWSHFGDTWGSFWGDFERFRDRFEGLSHQFELTLGT